MACWERKQKGGLQTTLRPTAHSFRHIRLFRSPFSVAESALAFMPFAGKFTGLPGPLLNVLVFVPIPPARATGMVVLDLIRLGAICLLNPVECRAEASSRYFRMLSRTR